MCHTSVCSLLSSQSSISLCISSERASDCTRPFGIGYLADQRVEFLAERGVGIVVHGVHEGRVGDDDVDLVAAPGHGILLLAEDVELVTEGRVVALPDLLLGELAD